MKIKDVKTSETDLTSRSPAGNRLIMRRSLHDEVLHQLRDMIVEGELAPGERISEKLLCEHFGISRTPLREALKVLATGGIYLGGGIPRRILPLLKGKSFTEGFLDKGRFADLLTRVPVYVITHPAAGVFGAACHELPQ